MAASSPVAKATPEIQLRSLVEKFDAKAQKLIRAVRAAMRKRLPVANELVYDYHSFFVIAYSATDRPTDGILSTAARPDGVRLYFINGQKLPDPKKLLQGSGKQTRFIQVTAAKQLVDPDVEALIAATIELAVVPLPAAGRGKLIMRTFGAQKRLGRTASSRSARK